MNYKRVETLIEKLASKNDVEATKELTKLFVTTRFGLSDEQFSRRYVDGKDDGGIDFYYREDDTFYIVQSKFSSKPHKTDEASISHEIGKIVNSIIGQNPNKDADEFINDIRKNLGTTKLLEIIWITTNVVNQSIAQDAQKELDRIRKKNNWTLEVDFVSFDKNALGRMIADAAHGYVPYTGKKVLNINGRCIENPDEGSGIYSIVCTAKVNDILSWFDQKVDVERFLQKNIREYLGDKKINRAIQKSYLDTPDWFWHKHNGIIIFADSVSMPSDRSQLFLRNPQVVNGGQTLAALFSCYDKTARKESSAQVLVRVYRLPYEESETYQKSIDIIKALNSQNPILPSDLRSSDPRQVRIETLLRPLGYEYRRKRGKRGTIKSTRSTITMRRLAPYYYYCRKGTPHEGARAEVEQIFDEQQRYDQTFPEEAIDNELSQNHPVMLYITVWTLAYTLRQFTKRLREYHRELSSYTRWYVMADVYNKLYEWKKNRFDLPGWSNWRDFVESEEFSEGLWKYARPAFKTAADILPSNEDPRGFFRRREATERFNKKIGRPTKFNRVMDETFRSFKRSLEKE